MEKNLEAGDMQTITLSYDSGYLKIAWKDDLVLLAWTELYQHIYKNRAQ